MDILGWHIIPRRNVEVAALESGSQLAYVRPVLAGYKQILGAIKAKNARRARSAARRHLAKGRECYLNFAHRDGQGRIERAQRLSQVWYHQHEDH